jgi:molecular chaperone HtpG
MSDGSPYRTGPLTAPKAEATEDGLVDELIQQFADPLAFYRELAQNSIDAGASRIVVAIGWEPAAGADEGTLSVSVRDDGSGMGRDVLENQLTVLFRSGKEGQEGKIGKFGVGFVSVLAVKPSLVEVRSSEGTGEQWTLQLAPDQTYELFRATGGGGAGTAVTLHIPMRRGEIEEFVKGSQRALSKWCRHAEIPIKLVASLADASEPMLEARIDRPLEVAGLVTARLEEGETIVVAGLVEDGEPYLGFFNRGLLLHETREDVLGPVSVKIQDSRLEHTLSRDNVRRDVHYERAMRLARRAIDDVLTRRTRMALHDAADGKRPDLRLDALFEAAVRAGFELDEALLRFPIVCPVGGRTTIEGRELGRAYVGTEPTALIRAASLAGHPVIDLSIAGASWGRYLGLLRARYFGAHSVDGERALPPAEDTLTLVTPVATSPSDLVLLDRVASLLAEVWRRPERPTFVELDGASKGRLSLAGGDDLRAPFVLRRDEVGDDPFRLLARPPLLLEVRHEVVRAARRAAAADATFAAAILVRAILLERGRLDDASDDAWLSEATRAIMERQ